MDGTSSSADTISWILLVVTAAIACGGIFHAVSWILHDTLGPMPAEENTGTRRPRLPLLVPNLRPSIWPSGFVLPTAVQALTLDEANESLRSDTERYIFDSANGAQGCVDVFVLSSREKGEDEVDFRVSGGVGGARTLFNGIYDGHAGWATSKILQWSLIPFVADHLGEISRFRPAEAIDEAIKTAFVKLDNMIMKRAAHAVSSPRERCAADVIAALSPAMSGSCALVTVFDIRTSDLRTALAGDSRAVLGSWCSKTQSYTADNLTEDQNGFNRHEVARLAKAHPGEKKPIIHKKTGLMLGAPVTRSFGDARWKWPTDMVQHAAERFFGYPALKRTFLTPPYMTALPEVTTRHVQPQDFVILGSGGLWDLISRQNAVACISRWLAAKQAGRPEVVKEALPGSKGYNTWGATPEHFAIEDLDNAAVCLVKNALGGNRRDLFRGFMTVGDRVSVFARDDIAVQIVFFVNPNGPEWGRCC